MKGRAYVAGMKILQNVLIFWLLVSVPGCLLAFGIGMKLIYETYGMAFFLLSCAFWFTGFLGIAALFDKRNPPE